MVVNLKILSSCLLLLLSILLAIRLEVDANAHSCQYDATNLESVCEPCKNVSWIDLVKPQSGTPEEKITDDPKTCYNNKPITIQHGETALATEDERRKMAQGVYRLSRGAPKTFSIQKLGFFRYAYELETPPTTGAPIGAANPLTEKYLDVDTMIKYYDRAHVPSGDRIFADFQLLEWPGRKSIEVKKEMKKELEDERIRICTRTATQDLLQSPYCHSSKVWMLRYDRDHGKILQYPCNKEEGINVVAFASLMKYNLTADTTASTTPTPPTSQTAGDDYHSDEHPQKVWLSHGRKSINNHYIQPLIVPEHVLLKMAKNATLYSHCLKDSDVTPGPGFVPLQDLRTVHDFDFTKHRLVLGMKCGVVVVSGIETEKLTFKVAMVKSEFGPGENLFDAAVNRISATTCCSNNNECEELSVVAAYSYCSSIDLGLNNFLYVSFDLGETFEKKIIASKNSPINLIRGLYKLYQQWDDYFQILHYPESRDLKEDDSFMANLRDKGIWDASTTEAKERLFRVGASLEERKMASLKKIAEIRENRVPRRQGRRGLPADRTPKWVLDMIDKRRKESGWLDTWTEDDCPNIPDCRTKFEYDRGVEWLLGDAGIHVVTPKRNESEPFCLEIVSILVVPEEMNIKGLCRIGYDRLNESGWDTNRTSAQAPAGPPTNDPISRNETGYFAIFDFPIKENLPLIYPVLVSDRVFSCRLIVNDMNEKVFQVLPALFRSPGSGTIFVTNCDGTLYVSTNFGKTLFNSVFYFEYEKLETYCKQDPAYQSDPLPEEEEPCHEALPTLSEPPTYIRSFHLCALNVPPLISVDVVSNVFLMTFGNFYARGAVAHNRESRLVVGTSIREIDYDRRFENLVVPGIAHSGETILTVALRQAYTIPDTKFKTQLYAEKHAIRLVPMLFQFYKKVRNFYDENMSICSDPLQKGLGFPPCKTISFSVKPSLLKLDLKESKNLTVRVKDDNPDLPLWVIASNPKSVGIQTQSLTQFGTLADQNDRDNFNLHEWNVTITAQKNEKDEAEAEALVDAFFGASYNTLHDYATRLTLVNTPTIRCHVQPSGTVHVELGCKGKRIVAHEEEHRPQCEAFKKNFQYTLKKGKYDVDLANYWLRTQRGQKDPFFKLQSNGDLLVTYDYLKWGCPIEPFGTDDFIPDLRIIPAKFDDPEKNKTGKAKRFPGRFILIEMFGATGYTYSKTLREMMEVEEEDDVDVPVNPHCKRAPQHGKKMLKEWRIRQRLFRLASYRQKFPTPAEINSSTFNFKKDVRGNRVFENEAVKEHINIWNRANFQTCHEESDSLSEAELDTPYELLTVPKVEYEEVHERTGRMKEKKNVKELKFEEIMHWEHKKEDDEDFNKKLNKIHWEKDHPRVYVFLAVAVDDYESFCTYQHVFGVSLMVHSDMDGITSFIIFLFFVMLWVVLLIGGYFFRRRLLRLSYLKQARHERLEQAAWTIIYRYEKLIHGSAVNKIPGKDVHHEARLKGVKTMHDKRMAELRMKKAAILAQEQAKHEKLQKTFDKE